MENIKDIRKKNSRIYREKKVSLNRIVEIYKYFKNKYDLYRKEYMEFYDSEIIPVLESGVLEIPYGEDERGILIFKFSKHLGNYGKWSWGRSSEILKPKNRESKLDWLLYNRDFSLGQKLNQFNKNNHRNYWTITQILKNTLTEYCRNNVKTTDGVINLKIGSDTFTLIKKEPFNEWSSYDLTTTYQYDLEDFEIEHYKINKF
jgi:hypothetical protein